MSVGVEMEMKGCIRVTERAERPNRHARSVLTSDFALPDNDLAFWRLQMKTNQELMKNPQDVVVLQRKTRCGARWLHVCHCCHNCAPMGRFHCGRQVC